MKNTNEVKATVKRMLKGAKGIRKIVLTDYLNKIKDGRESYLQDVITYGCVSGVVSELIYYSDTEKFFQEHKTEIKAMLSELLSECGYSSLYELFGDKFDKSDLFCDDTNNKNLLAWFGYEETANKIINELEQTNN